MSHARPGPGAEIRTFALASSAAIGAAPGVSVFPRYSARLARETLAVLVLVLLAAALATLATLLPGDIFAAPDPAAGCGTLDPWSLFSPWCAALI
jgi:hypothetical protein